MAARDDAEVIERTVRMVIYFAEFPAWRPLTEMLLGLIQRGEREEAIKVVQNIFRGLCALGVMPEDTEARIVAAFSTHFDMIQQGLADLPLDTDSNPFAQALAQAEESDDEDEEDDEEDDEEEDDEEYEDDEEGDDSDGDDDAEDDDDTAAAQKR